MKKVFSFLLVVMLIAGLSVNALAASTSGGNFVQSATAVSVPETLDGNTTTYFVSDTQDCLDAFYSLVAASPEDLVDPDNPTYADIANALKRYNEENGTGFLRVKVWKIFQCVVKPGTEPLSKIVKVPENYLCICKAIKEGGVITKWEEVEVDYDKDNNTITFTPEDGAVYAIFVFGDNSAPTGEAVPYVLLIAAVVLAGGAVVFFRKSRKANA